MDEKRKALAHQAGCLRKKYKLVPYEAAWCTLWLFGVKEKQIPLLSEEMTAEKKRK